MGGESVAKGKADPAPPGGAIYVFFTGILLGLVPIFSASLRAQGWISETIILSRLLFAAAGGAIGILYLHQKRSEPGLRLCLRRDHVWHFFGYGVVSIALVNFFYLKSLEYAPASVAVFSVFAAAPTVTLAVTWLRKRSQPTRGEFGLILAIIFGCLMVNYTNEWSDGYWRGVGFAVMAGFCYGLYSIFGQGISAQYSALCLLFWQFVFAGAATTAFFLMVPGYHTVFRQLFRAVVEPSWSVWFPAAGLGMAATFFPYLFYGYGLRQGLRPAIASALTLLEPVSTSVLAWVLLSQALSAPQIIGCVLVMVASLRLSQQRKDSG